MGVSRRRFVVQTGGAGVLLAGVPGFAAAAQAASFRPIPQRHVIRVIADNDYAGDPDGLVALAHQLLAPRARTVLITSSALDAGFPGPIPAGTTASAGVDIARKAMELLRIAPVPLAAGAEKLGTLAPSEAARAIVAEAMRDDPLPLVFTCGGPLTNLAAALELEPRIAARMKVIWIGGGDYPDGGWEYNLMADLPAARRVLSDAKLALTQVPQSTYRQMQMSIADMTARLRPISPFTQWLYEQFTSPPDFVQLGGSWPMGDTPTVLLGSVNAESSQIETVNARAIKDDGHYGAPIKGRSIEVCTHIDARLAFDDFLALLMLNAGG